MKTKTKILSVATALVMIAIILVANYSKVKAFVAYYMTDQPLGTLASTTASYKVPGVSTTTEYTLTDGIEQVGYLVAIGSSTTPPTVCARTEYSNNGLDWYGSNQATSTFTESIAPVQNCWTYASTTGATIMSTGPTGKENLIGHRFVVSGIDSQYIRTLFPVTGSNVVLDVVQNTKNAVVVNKN